MSAEIKTVSNPRLSLNILSQEGIGKIHIATLDVIECMKWCADSPGPA